MLLGVLTVVIMAIVAYAHWREGPLTAFAMCCNVLLAGVVAFNFWEPIANALDPAFNGSFLEGTEDALAFMLLFCPTLMLLRWLGNTLANTHMEYPNLLYRGGAVVFGLLTGYLISGFLVCVLQTLPWYENFMTFEPAYKDTSAVRRVLPPDVVWLAMMHRVSKGPLQGMSERPVPFDKNGSFQFRYTRHRRWNEKGEPQPHRGEFLDIGK